MAMEALKLQAEDSDEASEDSIVPKPFKTAKATKMAKPAKRVAAIKKAVSTEDEDEGFSDTELVTLPKSNNHTKPKGKPAVAIAKKPKKITAQEENEISGSDVEDAKAKKPAKKSPPPTTIEEEYAQVAQDVYDAQDDDENHDNNEPEDPLLEHAGPVGESAEAGEHSDNGDA